MSTADGRIIGTTKLLDNGPASLRWNLVLMGDGYQAAELPTFQSDADAFVAKLLSTEPFDRMTNAINVFRIDVVSAASGARDPVTCGGTGAAPRTFFDASFCGDNRIQRLLTVNSSTALSTAAAQVPQFRMAMVIVNSLQFGGSGGSVAVFSRDPSAPETAIHEMGHTAFGLADEYETFAGCSSGERDHDVFIGPEPIEPNVTRNISQLKWGRLVNTTALPTTTNPNPAQCDPRVESPVPPGTIGAFEGARFFHSGAFRPEFNCRMRVLGNPFCGVCQDIIRRHLAPFMPAQV